MRFQPSPHSYGVIGADQIMAAAQLTAAASGAGTSLSRALKKRKRRRKRRKRVEPPAAPPTLPVEPEKSKLPLILGGLAFVLAGTVGTIVYLRRKKRAQ